MLMSTAPFLPSTLTNMMRRLGEEASKETGVVMKIVLLKKIKLFATCAIELQKADKMLRCQVRVQSEAQTPAELRYVIPPSRVSGKDKEGSLCSSG